MSEQRNLFDNDAPNPVLTASEYNEVMAVRAKRLIESGEMPTLDEFWDAVAKVRKQYAPRIREARNE